MNRPFRPAPAATDDPTPNVVTTISIGMPHLALVGLSEKRLLEELGHVHWTMLARAAGRKVPDFRDERGAPVYAAFCALSIRDADFRSVRENDVLTVVSRTARVTRTQVASRHELSVEGRPVGEVELLSTFVHRKGAGNHTVARFEIAGLPPCGEDALGRALAEAAARHRAGLTVCEAGAEAPSFGFDPCPSTDFNGAGFLYFPSFLAFVDRAEWARDPVNARGASTLDRTVFFTGNLDPGETLLLAFPDWREATATGDLLHRCILIRGRTGQPIAEVTSRRQVAPRMGDQVGIG